MGEAVKEQAEGKHWTEADIPSQVGRRALVTGANSGIGYHTALVLAQKGAHVLLGCRDRGRGEAALARMRTEAPSTTVELAVFDLASLSSVREFAAAELGRGAALDLLINNAGVYRPKRRVETVDGFELQFGTNVLGHFALTALLFPALVGAAETRAERPRVVTVASIAHKQARLDFDDLQSAKSYSPAESYGQSKLANVMLALELARRLRSAGMPAARVMSVAAHPGIANTNLFVVGDFNAAEKMARRAVGVMIGVLLNDEAEGALPTLYAATALEAADGGYYGPQGFEETRGGDVGPAKIAAAALDEVAAARLWSECERLAGVKLL